MYAALWRLLPGPLPVRLLLAVVLVVAVGALLLLVVFPGAEQVLPADRGTVGLATPGPGPSAL